MSHDRSIPRPTLLAALHQLGLDQHDTITHIDITPRDITVHRLQRDTNGNATPCGDHVATRTEHIQVTA